MSEQTAEEYEPPRGSVVVVYLGPVAPHWEVRGEFGECLQQPHLLVGHTPEGGCVDLQAHAFDRLVAY